jgi:hypothetical protein
LAGAARYLIEFGLPLHQVGAKLYESLAALETDARSRLFRAGLGLRGQQLPK